jgi:arsenate reductase (glutaredoxin)
MAVKAKARAKRSAKAGRKVHFLQKPNCTTCRKARKFMEKQGFQLYFRDLSENRLSVSELEKLIGRRDYTDFLNSRNKVYRKKKMKLKPPSRREAIKMMAKEPNLIRRPVIVAGGQVVIGFDENGMARL